MSRNVIGSKVLKDIKVCHLEVGDRAPVIKSIEFQNVKLADEKEHFEVKEKTNVKQKLINWFL